MEMNTRLQVEHPVSEAITGLDFVEWQLRIAAGEGLPLTQNEITEHGHAFEARLYAENPNQNFAPSIGTLTTLKLPDQTARIDSGVEQGQAITPFYDPMIAKIITSGASRTEALGAMRAALAATRVAGLETNAAFLHALAAEPDFITGDVSTRFIEDHEAALFANDAHGPRIWAPALVARHVAARAGTGTDPWESLTGLRLNRPQKAVYWIEIDGEAALATLTRADATINVLIEPDASAAARREGRALKAPFKFSLNNPTIKDGVITLTVDGDNVTAFTAPHGEKMRLWIGADHWDISFPDPLAGISAHHSSEGSLTAPMPGVITLLSAKPGDTIEAGKPLLIMEAMKMEHAIKAPYDGVVKGYKFKAGDQVKDGDLLVEFEESA